MTEHMSTSRALYVAIEALDSDIETLTGILSNGELMAGIPASHAIPHREKLRMKQAARAQLARVKEVI